MSDIKSTLELIAEARDGAIEEYQNGLKKSFTVGSGLINYDLQRPEVRTVPFFTPLLDMIPRVKGNGGSSTHWKSISTFDSNNISASLGEGQRGGNKNIPVTDHVALYKGLGIDDFVTYEAEFAAEGFSDVLTLAVESNLYALQQKEETKVLGGNASIDLGTTPTPTASVVSTGGTLGAQQNVYCVALTLEGYKYSSISGGIALTYTRTNADATTTTITGFHAAKSLVASPTWSSGSTDLINASVAVVNGAMGYAWFWGTTGNEKLGAITLINSVAIKAAATGTQNISAVTDNSSTNALDFDGIVTTMITSGSGSYLYSMPTGTSGVGTGLTSNGGGGIVEFDNAVTTMWTNYKTMPTKALVSGKMKSYIAKLVTANGGAPLVRYDMNAAGDHTMIAGNEVTHIMSPLGMKMELVLQPDIPDNTIVLMAQSLPPQYFKMNNLGTTLVLKQRRDYYAKEWPQVSRNYQYGTYVDEVLQNYFPPAFGMINNIAIS